MTLLKALALSTEDAFHSQLHHLPLSLSFSLSCDSETSLVFLSFHLSLCLQHETTFNTLETLVIALHCDIDG